MSEDRWIEIERYRFTLVDGYVVVTVNGNPIDRFLLDRQAFAVAAQQWHEEWGLEPTPKVSSR